MKIDQNFQNAQNAQNAEKIFNISEVGNFHADQLSVFHGSAYASAHGPANEISDRHSAMLSNDHYNLIVYGSEPWFDPNYNHNRNHLIFPRDRALTEDYYIDSGLKARYSSFSPDAIRELKTFFCIFAYENKRGRWTDPKQQAAVGRLTEIKKRSNGIEIYFYPIFYVNQQRLNDFSFELGFIGSKGINELSHTHWTVKEIDLFEVLRDNDLLSH